MLLLELLGDLAGWGLSEGVATIGSPQMAAAGLPSFNSILLAILGVVSLRQV